MSTTEFWKTDDKDWMKARREEWKHVQATLNVFGSEDILGRKRLLKKYHKFHKELFFYGEIRSDCVEKMGLFDVDPLSFEGGGDVFLDARCFFEMWYHPDASLESYQRIFDQKDNTNELLASRRLLFKFQAVKFPQDYGMLGGREESFVKVFLPEYDYKVVKRFDGRFSEKPYPLCLPPRSLVKECYNGTAGVLIGKGRNPFNPGQYLWDHVSENMARFLWMDDIQLMLELFNEVLYKIKNYETSPEFPRDNEISVNLASNLKSRFEAEEFSEPLLELYHAVETI